MSLHRLFGIYEIKGTVMQIDKALIMVTCAFQKYPEKLAFQLFKTLQ